MVQKGSELMADPVSPVYRVIVGRVVDPGNPRSGKSLPDFLSPERENGSEYPSVAPLENTDKGSRTTSCKKIGQDGFDTVIGLVSKKQGGSGMLLEIFLEEVLPL